MEAESGRKNAVIALLGDGAGIDTKVKSGRTPLFWAAVKGYVEIAQLLLVKIAADLAAENGHEVVPELLMQWGGEVEDGCGQGLAEGGNREDSYSLACP